MPIAERSQPAGITGGKSEKGKGSYSVKTVKIRLSGHERFGRSLNENYHKQVSLHKICNKGALETYRKITKWTILGNMRF